MLVGIQILNKTLHADCINLHVLYTDDNDCIFVENYG